MPPFFDHLCTQMWSVAIPGISRLQSAHHLQRVILIDSIKHCIKHANRSSGPYAPTIQTMQRTNAMTVRLDHYQSWPIIALQPAITPTMAQAPHSTDTPAHHTSNTPEQTRLSSGTCQRRPWCDSPPLVPDLPPLQPFLQETPLPITALPPHARTLPARFILSATPLTSVEAVYIIYRQGSGPQPFITLTSPCLRV